jgi:uncharacterized membrane protein YcjF (UPF0283 family)
MWNWLDYGALIVGAVAVAAALVLLAVRLLQAWRSLKRLRRHLGKELDRLATLAEAAAEKTASATDTRRLDESLAALRETLARFAVLRGALEEVGETVGRVTAFVPRK